MQKSNQLAMNVLPWLWYPFTAVTTARSCAVTFLFIREVVTILLGVSGSLRNVTTRGRLLQTRRTKRHPVTVSHARGTDKIITLFPTELTVSGTFNGHGGKQPKSSYKCFAHRPYHPRRPASQRQESS